LVAACRHGVVVQAEEPADVHQRVLLGAHGAALAEVEHLAADVVDGLVATAGLALPDEPGVLGEPAGVEDQRHALFAAEGADRAHVRQRDGLPAAAVVGDREHDERDALAAVLREARPPASPGSCRP
jgi:hypothetical protein